MEENEFENIIVQTSSPYAELKAVAYNNDDDISNYDFNIISFYTDYIIALGNQKTLQGYKELEIFDDDKTFLNEKAILQQKYKIEIFKAKPKKHNLDISLGANKTLTKIIASVKKNPKARYYNGLKEDIIDDINKKLLKAKILLGIRSSGLFDGVQTLVNKIKVNGSLDEDFQFVVAVGIEPIDNSSGRVRLLYKEKQSTQEEAEKNKKIDYSNRGFVCAVRENDVILEFVKPKKGNDGKNLRGEYLRASTDNSNSDSSIKVYEDEIAVEDTGETLVYTAKRSGYILQDKDGRYGIKDNLELLKVDFKSTGSINAGLDKNVKLNVKENDILKDAIGPNVNVEIEEIVVEGSIAQNAVIKAQKAEIKGQTHSKSEVYAKDCKIAVHKGYCEGENIEIDRLENGEVHGKNVIIYQALGGKVYADSVYIKTLHMNSTFYVTQNAYVRSCQGENNKFIINPSNSTEIKVEMEKIMSDIAKVSKELALIPAPIKAKKSLIESNKDSIIKIKAKIEELRSQNVEPPEVFFNKLKDFQNLINEYNELVKQQKIYQKTLTEHEETLEALQERIFEARVSNKGRWRNLNEIRFILTYPEKEFVYNTKDGELAKNIRLERDIVSLDSVEFKININNTQEVEDIFLAKEASKERQEEKEEQLEIVSDK